MAKILCLIPARGGSKRIPRKNIKDFLGKPLLAWTIEIARQANVFDRIVLTTDNEEIAEIGRRYGAETPFMRPQELARDDTLILPVIQHSIKWLKDNQGYQADWIALLEPSSPGRRAFHLEEAVEIIKQDNFDCLCAVSEIPPHCNPLKSLKMDSQTMLTRYSDNEMVRNLTHHNQDIPPLYFINSALYLFKTANIFTGKPSVWGEKVRGYPMDGKYALDIDTADEWLVAETKMKKILEDETGSPVRNLRQKI